MARKPPTLDRDHDEVLDSYRARLAAAETGDDVVAALGDLTAVLDEADRYRDALFAVRLDLFRRGREVSPVATQKAMGDASGISAPMVVKALRKPA